MLFPDVREVLMREGVAMREFLVAIAPLACPVGMGLMLWMMMRGNHSGTEAERPEVAQLRAEIAELKAAREHQL